MLVFDMN